MPRIPEQTIEEIRRRADIVTVVETYVPLQKRNQEFWACCPFHQEKTPSFKLSPAHQTYHCFGCGVGGNVFQFVMASENVDFVGALHLLARRFNVVIPEASAEGSGQAPRDQAAGQARTHYKETLFSCLRELAEWYQKLLWREDGAVARKYLEQRGFERSAIERFAIGYAPAGWETTLQWGQRHNYPPAVMIDCGMLIKRENDNRTRVYDRFRNRLMFPIRDELGRVIGFSGRILEAEDKTAKYINTPETSLFHKGKLLYGLDLARVNFKQHGFALVCEGQLDVIACHCAGFDNAIAPQGTAFTENQARILKRFTPSVAFAFDADPAGLQAAAKSIEIALRMDLKPRAITLPDGEDPANIFQTRGGETLHARLAETEDAMEFLFRFACRTHDPSSAHGKDAIAWFLIDILAGHPSPILRSAYCQWLSQRLAVPESAVFEILNQRLREATARRRREPGATTPAVSGEGRLSSAGRPEPAAPASRLQAAMVDLLDLAIHHQPLARQMVDRLNREFLGHNPLARALNLVLDETENGKHAEAGKKLAADQFLCSHHQISRVLAGSRYPQSTRSAEEYSMRQRQRADQLLQRAVDDCLAAIELNALEDNLQQLDREIDKEADPDQQRLKLLEYQKLVQRSRQLRK